MVAVEIGLNVLIYLLNLLTVLIVQEIHQFVLINHVFLVLRMHNVQLKIQIRLVVLVQVNVFRPGEEEEDVVVGFVILYG